MPRQPLRERLLSGVYVTPPGSWKKYMGDNEGWGEVFTGGDSWLDRPVVAINDEKFQSHGVSSSYRDKMVLMETMHTLKDVDPVRYNRLYTKAIRDKDYMQWAKRSYARAQVTEGEERTFPQWHKTSRFDQILMSYLFAGDKDIPSMKGWSRDNLPIGRALRHELERLREDLEID